MNFDPSRIGPSAGAPHPQVLASTPSDDSTTTERLAGFRQPRPPRIASQSPRPRDAPDRPRIQRTRRTVDLSAATHRALDIWQREAADRLGVARVTGQEVLTALIDQLLADPRLAAQITRAIQERR
ncbi:MAG TPA: ATPase [Mycobacterium sp.]|nr:ATPase [Mycobacterium sp.]